MDLLGLVVDADGVFGFAPAQLFVSFRITILNVNDECGSPLPFLVTLSEKLEQLDQEGK